MTLKNMNSRIRQKRDTLSRWTSATPVLLNGEIAIVDVATGDVRIKIGNGTSTFTQLPYIVDDSVSVDYRELGQDEAALTTWPVNLGGTGATTAAGARSNLGVTSALNTKFDKSGGTLTGNVEMNRGTTESRFRIIRTVSGDECMLHMAVNADGDPLVSSYVNGVFPNRLLLGKNNTTCLKPLNVASGGTGATTASSALSNLGFKTKTVTATTSQYGNIVNTGLNITDHVVLAAVVTDADITNMVFPYNSGGDWALKLQTTGTTSSSVSNTSRTVKIYYLEI